MNSLDAVLDCVRAKGERVTIPRRLVIEALLESADHHRTIQDIQAHIQQHQPDFSISDTTIYRILQWLKNLEIVSQTDMGRAGIIYALIDEPAHHHLICLSCGTISNLDDTAFDALRQHIQQQYGFTARIDHMAIYGQCPACAHQPASSEAGGL